ncbi:hypothetical protein B0H14DRAFT_2983239, partial [Mycena olivaceomarginata]
RSPSPSPSPLPFPSCPCLQGTAHALTPTHSTPASSQTRARKPARANHAPRPCLPRLARTRIPPQHAPQPDALVAAQPSLPPIPVPVPVPVPTTAHLAAALSVVVCQKLGFFGREAHDDRGRLEPHVGVAPAVAGVTVLVLVVLTGDVNVERFDVVEVATENPELGGLGPRKLEKLRRPLASPASLDNRDTTADKSSDPPLLACCCPKPTLW